MIRVCLEVREEDDRFRVAVHAESITRAVNLIERRHPGRDVRVVFPIDPEGFFVPRENGVREDEGGELLPLREPAMRAR
jgi:hypothetical protein